jgi:hypothetical protein
VNVPHSGCDYGCDWRPWNTANMNVPSTVNASEKACASATGWNGASRSCESETAHEDRGHNHRARSSVSVSGVAEHGRSS